MTTTADALELKTLADLRNFIHIELCARENLLPEESRMHEMAIRREGELCGMQFFVHGPRLVRLSAVWAAEQNVVFLYDARGERYNRINLPSRITIEDGGERRLAS
ncbi:MAG: hypothetical protein R3B90_12170 [Planctomycetaceae bacterium]